MEEKSKAAIQLPPPHRLRSAAAQDLPAPPDNAHDINNKTMSAPQIPNLLDSLRSGRGGHRGRGRGGRRNQSERGESHGESQDRIVQQTDDDALNARVSAVDAGWLNDPFVKAFVTQDVERRDTSIMRGELIVF